MIAMPDLNEVTAIRYTQLVAKTLKADPTIADAPWSTANTENFPAWLEANGLDKKLLKGIRTAFKYYAAYKVGEQEAPRAQPPPPPPAQWYDGFAEALPGLSDKGMQAGAARTNLDSIRRLHRNQPGIFNISFNDADTASTAVFKEWLQRKGIVIDEAHERAAFRYFIMWKHQSTPPDRAAVEAGRVKRPSVGTGEGVNTFAGHFLDSSTVGHLTASAKIAVLYTLKEMKKNFAGIILKEYPAEVVTRAQIDNWVKGKMSARKHKEFTELDQAAGRLKYWIDYTRSTDYQPGADQYW